MNRLLLIILFIFNFSILPFLCFAQEKQGKARIDSLLNQLLKVKEDTSKVKLLNDLSDTYSYISADEGIKIGKEAFALSEKLNWKKGMAASSRNTGIGYEAKADYPKALEYYFKALKLFEELRDKRGITKTLGDIGIIYDYQSDYPRALEYYLKVLKMCEDSGDKNGVAAYLGNIGVIYKNKSKYSEALKYYLKALNIYEELEDKSGIAINLSNIGVVYDIQFESSKALEYYFRALKIFNELGDDHGKAVTLSNIAFIYLSKAKKSGNKMVVENKNTLLKKAKLYTDSTIILFNKTGDLKNLFQTFQQLSEIQSLQEDNKGALKSYMNYTLFKDSVFNMDKEKKITETAMQYEFDKKETLAKAEQEKKDAIAIRTMNLQYTAIGAFLLLGIFLFYGYNQKNKAKIKIERAYTDLKSAQSQLIQSEKMASLGELTAGIAHEIQNPLNFVNNFSEVNTELIGELVEEVIKGNTDEVKAIAKDIKENSEKINNHGQRAAAIVKGMLQHSRSSSGVKEPTDINALCDEYLRLSYHGLRAKDKSFNATMKTDFDSTIGSINIIPQDIGRVMLNLVNNAFYVVDEKKKTGIAGYEPTVTIATRYIQSPGDRAVEIKVSDNGNGIPPSIKEKIFQPFFTTKPTGKGTGLGLSLSYDIVKAHGGELKVVSEEGQGCTFIIHLPVA